MCCNSGVAGKVKSAKLKFGPSWTASRISQLERTAASASYCGVLPRDSQAVQSWRRRRAFADAIVGIKICYWREIDRRAVPAGYSTYRLLAGRQDFSSHEGRTPMTYTVAPVAAVR
jgi:hypothetical protein